MPFLWITAALDIAPRYVWGIRPTEPPTMTLLSWEAVGIDDPWRFPLRGLIPLADIAPVGSAWVLPLPPTRKHPRPQWIVLGRAASKARISPVVHA